MEWEPFRIDEREIGPRMVLAVHGEVDLATAPQLSRAIERADAFREIWIDLSATSFMDSTGLATLVGAYRSLAGGGRRLTVICPAGPVRRVFELSGVDQHLELLPDGATPATG